ncbi:MAG TPA: hypothetical protein DD670_01090 [Planctomycetaceae bacterium]|nr:hypothetical protein [Planctomycetaceae bacterium]
MTHAYRHSRRRIFAWSRASLGLLLVVAGCASPLGNAPGRPLLPSSTSRDIQRACENDPFPTASQAGLVPVTATK